jgi:hypothetical protein
MRRWRPIAVIAAGLAAMPAQGQEALYGKQPPPGAAFVRFISTLPAAITIDTGRGRLTLGAAPTPYEVVERGRRLAIATPSFHAVLDPAPGSHTTLVFRAGEAGGIAMAQVADDTAFNQARARLAFYNLAPGCPEATLALLPGGQAIFAQVGPGQTRSRSVSPAEATVQALCGPAPGPTLALSGMEAGRSYSVWLTGAGLSLTADAVAPYRPPGG